jgi:hypothetical protein
MPINLPQKRADVKPPDWNRSNRIVSYPLRIDPVTYACQIPLQRSHTLF